MKFFIPKRYFQLYIDVIAQVTPELGGEGLMPFCAFAILRLCVEFFLFDKQPEASVTSMKSKIQRKDAKSQRRKKSHYMHIGY